MRRKIFELAWPAILGNLLQTIVSLVDLIMVGQLGSAAVASVGLGGQMLWFLHAIMVSVSVGTTALVARFIGAEKREEAEHVLTQSIMLVLLLSAALTVIWYVFAEDFFLLIGATTEVAQLGSTYIRIVFLTTPCIFMIFNSEGALRGAGDTKTPMKVGAVMNGINVVLNYGLIFGKFGLPALGVRGAGIATAIAYVWAAITYSGIFFSGKFALRITRSGFNLNMETVRRIIRIGLPASIQRIIMSGSMIFYVSIITGFGTTALAAHQIGLRIESLSYMPGFGFAVAATALVGQNLGAHDPQKAEQSGWEAAKLGALLMGSAGLCMIIFPSYMARLFVSDPQVVNLAIWYLRIVGISEPGLALIFTLAGGLQGAGDTRSPLYISVFGLWIFRIPLAYLLGVVLGWGVIGAWTAMTVDTFVRGGLYVFRFRAGKWKQVQV
ncbi:MAG: MATE family efflux transporter [Theionarchaea archaeon]|nr:MATE family efflux transporter [Theionarchaea archaeon]